MNRLTKFARELRRKSTDAETFLWKLLRNRRLKQYKFRRQHVIPPYIVDFACLRKKLVVELDGCHHADPKVKRYDERRSRYLRAQGYEVIRFWNSVVFRKIEEVIDDIIHALEKR
ncbi:MAG: endonuclease domain-containing protein [Gammaproteobacteria bacterium]|nr:MAG: endonuclease domain-containing protein [Gammaproteobacteria bacterium]